MSACLGMEAAEDQRGNEDLPNKSLKCWQRLCDKSEISKFLKPGGFEFF